MRGPDALDAVVGGPPSSSSHEGAHYAAEREASVKAAEGFAQSLTPELDAATKAGMEVVQAQFSAGNHDAVYTAHYRALEVLKNRAEVLASTMTVEELNVLILGVLARFDAFDNGEAAIARDSMQAYETYDAREAAFVSILNTLNRARKLKTKAPISESQ